MVGKMKVFFTAMIFFAGLAGLEAQVSTEATFEPAEVTEGNQAIYRLSFSFEGGGRFSLPSADPPALPTVNGLSFRYVGPRTQVVTTNGETTAVVSHLYQVDTTTSGTFEVPSFRFGSGPARLTIPSAQLIVRPRGEVPSGDDGVPSNQPVWMDFVLPREKIYVGESVPVQIRLFVNNDRVIQANLVSEGGPEKIGDAFSIGDLGSISQRQVQRGNTIITVAEWTALITPLKTGAQPLLFELPVQITTRDPGTRRGNRFDSLFGPSLFDQMFGSQIVRAYSENREIDILPLPSANRPDDFSGGIGNFEFSDSRLSSDQVQVGEPFLYSVTIEGEGNFDRMGSPTIKDADDRWRLYDPETSFSAFDELGFSGSKTFTFTLVPRSDELEQTPSFSLSYFSPETGTYEALEIPPRPLSVLPAPPGSRRPALESGEKNPVEARRGPDLLPLAKDWTGASSTPGVPYTSILFIGTQVILAVGLLVGWIAGRHYSKLRTNSAYAKRVRSKRRVRKALREATQAAATGDSAMFYGLACECLREAVGPNTPGDPESLTEAEVLQCLPGSADHAIRNACSKYFQTSEGISYGARKKDSKDLQQELAELRKLVRKITHPTQPGRGSGIQTPAILLAVLGSSLLPQPAEAAANKNDDPESVFSHAVSLYEEGSFEEAAGSFSHLAGSQPSAAVYYNLGNTYYQLRDYAQAILAYRRALLSDPTDPDTLKNLDLTLEAAGIEPAPEPYLSAIGFRLPWSTWLWLGSIGFWVLLALWALSRPLQWNGLWRNTGIFLSATILLVSIAGQVPWFLTRSSAIVLTKEAPLRLAPTATSPLETKLTAGSLVKTGKTYGEYTRVEKDGELQGWVLTKSIGQVWSSSPK